MSKQANNQQQAAEAAAATVSSTSDERTVNNDTVRHNYRVLTDREKAQVTAIKDAGAGFLELLDFTATQGSNSRELSIARTKIEEAVMWGVKHVTK